MVVGQNTLHRMKCIRDGSVSSGPHGAPRWVAIHSRPMSRPTVHINVWSTTLDTVVKAKTVKNLSSNIIVFGWS